MAIGDRRKIRKSKSQKPKKIRSRKPIKAKYASTQYSLVDEPKISTGGEIVEANQTVANIPQESKHTKRTFLKDLTGNLFKIKEETTVKKPEGDGTFESTQTGIDKTESKGKNLFSKKAGVKVNEVYKMRNMGDIFNTGQDSYDLDIKRRVTQSNRANEIFQSNTDSHAQSDPSKHRITEHDYARRMQVEKFRGKSGTKRKMKSYVDKSDMGGTRTFELQKGSEKEAGQYKQIGSTKTTKKEMKEQGFKPISSKRFERIARRQSNFGQRRTAQGMDQAAGGKDGTKSFYADPNQEQTNKKSFQEAADRLFEGKAKRSDLYVSRQSRKRNKRNK